MAHEVETKVLDIDLPKLLRKLKSLGAKKVGKDTLEVDWYRPNGVKPGEDPWYLRIRTYSGKRHEVTWKAKSDIFGVARKHKEINFDTAHLQELADLFMEIGLEKYAHQEKVRTSFTYKKWRFDIDQYPNMPPFVEIEGASEKHVNEALKLLELESHKTWAEGERILIEKVYGLNWYEMRF